MIKQIKSKNTTIPTLTTFEKEFGLQVNDDGQIIVSSLTIAEKYGKEHKNVIAKVKEFIELIPELNGLNFKLVDYMDAKGEKRPMYVMDRQGFSMLVNKFTGKEATLFTYKYTKAFEEMAEELEHLKQQKKEIEEKLHKDKELSLDDYNDIRFSIGRTIKTFELCEVTEVKTLVHDFIDYVEALDTGKRVTRCKSAVKGLDRLHDKLASESVANIGDCYNLLRFQDNIKTVSHMAENRHRGQKIAHRNKKIKTLENQIA